MKSNIKKLIALTLVMIMLIGTVSVGASAECRPFRYVALGDSTSMGYMLDDFDNTYDHRVGSSEYSMYSLMVNYLKDVWKLKNIDSTDLTMTGMRPAELRAVLDTDYFAEKCDGIYDTSLNFCDQHLDYYLRENDGYGSYDRLHSTYVEKLSEADLITYDLLMADFGTYFGDRFTNLDSEKFADDNLPQLLADEGWPVIAECVDELGTKLSDALSELGLPMDTVNSYLDAILFSYANLCINFSKSLDLIYDLNPDVSVIVVGPFNILNDLIIEIKGFEITASSIWEIIRSAIESYIVCFDKNCWRYRYADCSGGVELVIEAMKDPAYLQSHDTIRNELYNELSVNYDAAAPEVQAMYNENIAAAASANVVPILDVMDDLGNQDMMRRAITGEGVTDADRAMMNVGIRFTIGHATGSHPSEKGYLQKFEAIKRAFVSPVAANGAYLSRIVNNTASFAGNFLAAVLGCRTAVAKIVSIVKSVFTPLIRFPSIFG